MTGAATDLTTRELLARQLDILFGTWLARERR
jgi:hypothetical protein